MWHNAASCQSGSHTVRLRPIDLTAGLSCIATPLLHSAPTSVTTRRNITATCIKAPCRHHARRCHIVPGTAVLTVAQLALPVGRRSERQHCKAQDGMSQLGRHLLRSGPTGVVVQPLPHCMPGICTCPHVRVPLTAERLARMHAVQVSSAPFLTVRRPEVTVTEVTSQSAQWCSTEGSC